MMNNSKLFYWLLLSSISWSITNTVLADAQSSCETGPCAPVSFAQPIPEFRDVACAGLARTVVYTLKNHETTVALSEVYVTTQTGKPDTSIVTVVPTAVAGSCVTSVVNGVGSGSVPGNGSCQLTLTVTPPSSGCNSYLAEFPIARQLHIVVGGDQAPLTLDLNADMTILGSGAHFAVLGNTVNNGTQSPAQIIGDLGSVVNTTGNFDVTGGKYIGAAASNPIRTAAENDFKAAFTNLSAQMASHCQTRNTLNAGSTLYPGFYCLNAPSGAPNNTTEFYVGGDGAPITLVDDGSGGNFYFFVDSGTTATCKTNTGTATSCNLNLRPKTTFAYQGDANPNNVYWIMGTATRAGQVKLNSDAEFDGSVLLNASTATSPVFSASLGTSPTLVRGSLWTLSTVTGRTTQLQGNTVVSPHSLATFE